jgi:hypothetical protein
MTWTRNVIGGDDIGFGREFGEKMEKGGGNKWWDISIRPMGLLHLLVTHWSLRVRENAEAI